MKTDRHTSSRGDWTDQDERLLFLAAVAYQLPCINDFKKPIDLSNTEQTLDEESMKMDNVDSSGDGENTNDGIYYYKLLNHKYDGSNLLNRYK